MFSPKLIAGINEIPIKFQVFFSETWQANSKIYMEKQKPKDRQDILEEEKNRRKIMWEVIMIYYKVKWFNIWYLKYLVFDKG